MKIITKAVYVIETLDLVKEESFEYFGPVTRCFTVGTQKSSGESAPDPIMQEIVKAFFEESTPLRQGLINQIFMPLITGEPYAPPGAERGPITGYRTEGLPGDPEAATRLTQEISGLERNLAQGNRFRDESDPGWRDRTQRQIEGLRAQLAEVAPSEREIAIYGDAPPGEAPGGGLIPIISAAQEAGKSSVARTGLQTREELARTGLAGTPFGEAILAATRQKGAFDVSQISPNISMDFLKAIPGFVTGTQQTVASGGAALGTSQQSGKGFSAGIASGPFEQS